MNDFATTLFSTGGKCCKTLQQTGTAAGSYIYLFVAESARKRQKVKTKQTYNLLQLQKYKIIIRYVKTRKNSVKYCTIYLQSYINVDLFLFFCLTLWLSHKTASSWLLFSVITSFRLLTFTIISRTWTSFTAHYVFSPCSLFSHLETF